MVRRYLLNSLCEAVLVEARINIISRKHEDRISLLLFFSVVISSSYSFRWSADANALALFFPRIAALGHVLCQLGPCDSIAETLHFQVLAQFGFVLVSCHNATNYSSISQQVLSIGELLALDRKCCSLAVSPRAISRNESR